MTRARLRLLLTASFEAAALIVLFYVLPLGRGGWLFDALLIIVGVAGIGPLAVHYGQKVVNSDRPLFEAARAAILLLTVLVVTFGAAYYELDSRNDDAVLGLETKTDALYFTVTTLTTVGYGDISPASQPARVVASVQMLADLAFLGVGIRLLTRAVETSRGRTGAP